MAGGLKRRKEIRYSEDGQFFPGELIKVTGGGGGTQNDLSFLFFSFFFKMGGITAGLSAKSSGLGKNGKLM